MDVNGDGTFTVSSPYCNNIGPDNYGGKSPWGESWVRGIDPHAHLDELGGRRILCQY